MKLTAIEGRTIETVELITEIEDRVIRINFTDGLSVIIRNDYAMSGSSGEDLGASMYIDKAD